MGVAKISALRSKDPSTQVGACIVNDKNRIVGVGYNGMPNGCSDDWFPWEQNTQEPFHFRKYAYVVHAELNAILNASVDICGSTIYCTLYPCNECAKAIVQSGIKKVVYLSDKNKNTDPHYASERIFSAAKVECLPFSGNTEIIFPLRFGE